MRQKTERLLIKKKELLKKLPSLGEIIRGTFNRWYLTCQHSWCQCHQNKKYRHGPYLRITRQKDGKPYQIYVPFHLEKKAKKWVKNYHRLWQGMEKISDLNIKLLRLMSKNKRWQK